MKTYRANETFLSIQGEGARVGTANVFLRFAGCNLTCSGEEVDGQYQPLCDTEFASGTPMSAAEIVSRAVELWGGTGPEDRWVIATGGEPALQLDADLLDELHAAGFLVAAETNGTRELPAAVDWISVSPKTAEHTLRVQHLPPTRGHRRIDELRYVRHDGQAIPRPTLVADHRFVSPAWSDDAAETRRNVAWCVRLVKENPSWRLSAQLHKLWGAR